MMILVMIIDHVLLQASKHLNGRLGPHVRHVTIFAPVQILPHKSFIVDFSWNCIWQFALKWTFPYKTYHSITETPSRYISKKFCRFVLSTNKLPQYSYSCSVLESSAVELKPPVVVVQIVIAQHVAFSNRFPVEKVFFIILLEVDLKRNP